MFVFFLDVHPNYHSDHFSQPVCFCVSGDALHAQGLHHPLPPRAERTQTKTQLQGEVDSTYVLLIFLYLANPFDSLAYVSTDLVLNLTSVVLLYLPGNRDSGRHVWKTDPEGRGPAKRRG